MLLASLGPLLVSVKTYSRRSPALTGSGVSVRATARSAETVVVVLMVAELFEPSLSVVVLEAEAVLVIVTPAAVLEATFATRVKVAVAPDARLGLDAKTVPAEPTAGVVNV